MPLRSSINGSLLSALTNWMSLNSGKLPLFSLEGARPNGVTTAVESGERTSSIRLNLLRLLAPALHGDGTTDTV